MPTRRGRTGCYAAWVVLAGLAGGMAAHAQTPPAQAGLGGNPADVVVQTTPIEVSSQPRIRTGIDAATAPQAVQVLGGAALAPNGLPDPFAALDRRATGVSLSDAAGNPFQPGIVYHGFEISPLQGTPQGLAVYVDGIRFNQPFGDTVELDLLAPNAIRSLTVQDANPEFGLNALGGAIDVQMKNGFTDDGGQIDLSGGSFGRVGGDIEYGRQQGNQAVYVAAGEQHEAGWRDDQSSDIQTFYGDLGWRTAAAELHVNLTAAHAALNGPGTAPVQLIAADPSAQYTAPNSIDTQYARLGLSLTTQLDAHRSLRLLAYYDYFHEAVANGNAPNDLPCFPGAATLCQSSGAPSTTLGGAPIAAFAPGDFYSELDQEVTNTNGYGASAQLADTRRIGGLANRLVAGLDYDGAETGFAASGLIGGITPVSRTFIGPGVLIDEPGTNIPVSVGIGSGDYGVYLADTLHVTQRLALTASARLNVATIDLTDHNGGDLNGYHVYAHLNPALGATWQLTPLVSVYAGYSEANRAPTPAELSCAGPQNACSLANFFVADPALKQVVAHRFEVGLRGQALVFHGGTLSYDVDYYHSVLDDDIAFITAPTQGRAYFANIGSVLRQGIDLGLHLETDRWNAWISYSRVVASYQSSFVELGGANPFASADGTITVLAGDLLPGVPQNTVKFGFDWQATRRWSIGLSAVAVTSSYLYGDAANLDKPLPGYVVVNLMTRYRLTPDVELFGSVENLTDARYYTYGTYTALGSVQVAQVASLTNPRSYSVGPPIGGFVGLRVQFR